MKDWEKPKWILRCIGRKDSFIDGTRDSMELQYKVILDSTHKVKWATPFNSPEEALAFAEQYSYGEPHGLEAIPLETAEEEYYNRH